MLATVHTLVKVKIKKGIKRVLNMGSKYTYKLTDYKPNCWSPSHALITSPSWTPQIVAPLKQELLPLQETLPVRCEFGRTLPHILRTTQLPVEIEVSCVYSFINVISGSSPSVHTD